MQPFIEAIISTIAVSAFIAAIFFIFYLTVVKGSESPLRLYNRFKNRYKEHSHTKRVKERMYGYETISGMHKPSLLGSTILLSILVLVISLLLFKVVFFTAVTSGSMSPTFERGDLVLMQRIHPEPVEGDIIMLQREEYMLPITHRVVSVTEGGVRTKGDARSRVDPWVIPEEEIIAKTVQVGEKPLVLKDVGDYFILDPKEMRIGKYGSEYAFVKNLFLTIRVYGYALCIIAILGYVILTIKERR